MGSIQILLGKTRTRRRAALRSDQMGDTDPFGHPTFLYVTDSVRKTRLVEQEYVRYRRGASFVPAIRTLSAVLEDLVARFGDGRALWRPAAVELLVERMAAAEPALFAPIAAMGRQAFSALARLHQGWDEAGKPPLAGRRGPVVQPMLEALDRRLTGDRAARPTGDALRDLCGRLRLPGGALYEWLGRWHSVVVDDVLHPSPVRRDALLALAAGWRARGAHVVVSFETGRDLGGHEAERFFDYGDEDAVAFSLRPFVASRAFRRHVFEALAGEGEGVELALARADRSLLLLDRGVDPGVEEEPDLADCLYAGLRARRPDPNVRFVRWGDPAAEVRGIAREVKERLLAGVSPSDLWVAFPGLPAYAPLVARVFGELGVPYELSSGVPLFPLPITGLILSLARIAGEGFPVDRLLTLLSSPVVGRLDRATAWRAGRILREHGVRGGAPSGWAGFVRKAEERDLVAAAAAAAEPLCPMLEGLSGELDAREWRDRLSAAVEGLGLVERAWELVGVEGGGSGAARAVRAVAAILAEAEAVAADAWSADPGPWSTARLTEVLAERLRGATVAEEEATRERVLVVGMLELRGIHPRHLWIGGLCAADFPPGEREDWLLPRAERVPLDEADPAQEARYLFTSALRNAQDDPTARLVLSWPESREGGPMAPSTLLADVLDLPLLGGEGSVGTRTAHVWSLVEAGGEPGVPASRDELDRLAGGLAGSGVVAPGWAAAADPEDAGLARQRPLAARRDPAGFGVYDGVLSVAPTLPRPLQVTALETFVQCPARYFYGRLLGARPEDAFDPDLDARTRGDLLHAVLQRFVNGMIARDVRTLSALDDTSSPTLAEVQAVLHATAVGVLDGDPEVGDLAPALVADLRRRWLGGLVDDAPAGLLLAWLRVEVTSPVPRRLEEAEWPHPWVACGPAVLTGRVDRVDRLPDDTPLVIDYKTGLPPSARKVRAGLAIQPLVYMDAAAADGPALAVYETLKAPSAVRYAGWVGEPGAARALAGRGRVVELTLEDRASFRADRALAAERLAAGRFHPTLAGAELAGCEHCPYAGACRVDHDRNERIRAGADPRWQAPREDALATNDGEGGEE